MLDREQIVAALVDSGVCARDGIVGCSEAFVDDLERAMQVALPRQYREFLFAAGRAAPGFFTGTDFFGRVLYDLREGAIELLEENGNPFALPDDAFVFTMHQGYQFHYFRCDGTDDPRVYYYVEGQPVLEIESLSAYLLGSIDWHRRMREAMRGPCGE